AVVPERLDAKRSVARKSGRIDLNKPERAIQMAILSSANVGQLARRGGGPVRTGSILLASDPHVVVGNVIDLEASIECGAGIPKRGAAHDPAPRTSDPPTGRRLRTGAGQGNSGI